VVAAVVAATIEMVLEQQTHTDQVAVVQEEQH
jgi:hypothetical protein